MTSFSVGKEEFFPNINVVTQDLLLNFTFENVREHPNALFTVLFMLILLCLGWYLLYLTDADHGKDRPVLARAAIWDIDRRRLYELSAQGQKDVLH